MIKNVLSARKDLLNLVPKYKGDFDGLEKDLESRLNSIENIQSYLIAIQVIPEKYGYSSSLEKTWAKASDIILSNCFRYIGLESKVLRVRGDDADIFAEYKSQELGYSLVGDAKCFRISRTAKNQKDFKVSSMADWRRQNTFAVLCAPLFAYPKDKSQIYRQAFKGNVFLISYTHLAAIVGKVNPEKLAGLMNVKPLFTNHTINTGNDYWKAINELLLKVAGIDNKILKYFFKLDIKSLSCIKELEKKYYDKSEEEIRNMSKEQLEEWIIRLLRIKEKARIMDKMIESYKNWLFQNF